MKGTYELTVTLTLKADTADTVHYPGCETMEDCELHVSNQINEHGVPIKDLIDLNDVAAAHAHGW